MLRELMTRIRQGHQTADAFPGGPPPVMPERFRGAPKIDPARCKPAACARCVEACPTQAARMEGGELTLDLGRCLFCPACAEACQDGALTFTGDIRLAASKREDLIAGAGQRTLAAPLAEELRALFGRSLKLRQVSAGGCNGCEAEITAMNNVVFDASRFGVQVVASPRHADGLLVTGPVTENMRIALLKTWEATPAPKIVIAAGACAISGGPYRGHPEQHDGVGKFLPVDLYIPGCPPHPLTILDGLLRLMGRVKE